jgi:hypothetical protein
MYGVIPIKDSFADPELWDYKLFDVPMRIKGHQEFAIPLSFAPSKGQMSVNFQRLDVFRDRY